MNPYLIIVSIVLFISGGVFWLLKREMEDWNGRQACITASVFCLICGAGVAWCVNLSYHHNGGLDGVLCLIATICLTFPIIFGRDIYLKMKLPLEERIQERSKRDGFEKKSGSDKKRKMLIEIRECRNEFLDVAKKHKKYDKLVALYKEWDNYYFKGYVSSVQYIHSLDKSIASRKAKKIDPYIAGGAAQAIGGAGLGVYSAISAEQHNREIEQARTSTYIAAREAEANKEFVEACLWEACENITELLNTMPETEEIRNCFWEKLYKDARWFEKQRTTSGDEKAIEKYTMLDDYKDSKHRLRVVSSRKLDKEKEFEFKYGTVPTIIVLIITTILVVSCGN